MNYVVRQLSASKYRVPTLTDSKYWYLKLCEVVLQLLLRVWHRWCLVPQTAFGVGQPVQQLPSR